MTRKLWLVVVLFVMAGIGWTLSTVTTKRFLDQCSFGHTSEVVGMLNARPWLLEVVDKDGMTCLINSGKHGHVDLVRVLISQFHVQLNQPQGAIHHALRGAALYGRYEVCKLLLESGAQVNALSRGKLTALMGAARAGHLHIAQLLLDYGADCAIQNQYLETARELNPDLIC